MSTIIVHKSDGTITVSGEPAEPCPRCRREVQARLIRDGACYHCREFEVTVRQGLRWAGLTPLPSAALWKTWSPLAAIGALEVSHSGRGYWSVKGHVPLATAKLLYADPAGRDLIRVAGHCGCPPPEEWLQWRLPDGRRVASLASKAECELAAASMSGPWAEVGRAALAEYVFSDDPASIGAQAFVDHYHIDGDLGLRVFVDIVRAAAPEVAA